MCDELIPGSDSATLLGLPGYDLHLAACGNHGIDLAQTEISPDKRALVFRKPSQFVEQDVRSTFPIAEVQYPPIECPGLSLWVTLDR
jgi:hypothetical protein